MKKYPLVLLAIFMISTSTFASATLNDPNNFPNNTDIGNGTSPTSEGGTSVQNSYQYDNGATVTNSSDGGYYSSGSSSGTTYNGNGDSGY